MLTRRLHRFALPLLVALPLLFASCATRDIACPMPAPLASALPVARVKILVTNDVHGYAVPQPDQGRIGYALLKGYADSLRRQGWTVYLVDAGDTFSGSAYANLDSGRSIARVVGKMGYSVLAPGNHAFDFNALENDFLYYPDTLLATVKRESPTPTRVTALNLSWQGGPVPEVERGPVVLHDANGLRIVAAGVLTPYTAIRSDSADMVGYGFDLVEQDGGADHEATKRRIMTDLAEALSPYTREGDVTLVLSHVGYDDSDEYSLGQISGRDLALVPGVDFVADAHSHLLVGPDRIGDAWYGMGGRYLENVTEITLIHDVAGLSKSMSFRSYADIVNTAGVEPDAAITALLAEVADGLGLSQELFVNPDAALFTDDDIRLRSTPKGRLVARAMARAAGADLGVYNGGGIRAGLPPGMVTAADAYNVCPFINTVQTYDMTGRQIRDMFTGTTFGGGGFPQFHGMTVYGWVENGALRVAGIRDRNGAELADDAVYSVAFNSFMAEGGDGFVFENLGLTGDYGADTDRLIEVWQGMPQADLESVLVNDALLIYPDPIAAEKAFRLDRPERAASVPAA